MVWFCSTLLLQPPISHLNRWKRGERASAATSWDGLVRLRGYAKASRSRKNRSLHIYTSWRGGWRLFSLWATGIHHPTNGLSNKADFYSSVRESAVVPFSKRATYVLASWVRPTLSPFMLILAPFCNSSVQRTNVSEEKKHLLQEVKPLSWVPGGGRARISPPATTTSSSLVLQHICIKSGSAGPQFLLLTHTSEADHLQAAAVVGCQKIKHQTKENETRLALSCH